MIRIIGGNTVEGPLIDGFPVAVMEVQLMRPLYTLSLDTGRLGLFYFDGAGNYRSAYVEFDALKR